MGMLFPIGAKAEYNPKTKAITLFNNADAHKQMRELLRKFNRITKQAPRYK